VTNDLPLPALLSRPLVAFTIEFDNESEHRLPHRTTWGPAAGSRRGPWLVSQAMWANFMQFVGAGGAPLRDLDDLARITNLAGLERWGYIVVHPDPADGRPVPPRRDWIVAPTPAGRRAQHVWQPLADMIEDRWRDRFGASDVIALRAALAALVAGLDVELPPYLPVVTNEMFADIAGFRARPPAVQAGRGTDLSMLLSQVLLAFTLDFEGESPVSLAVSINALRVLTDGGIRVRDLPGLTGVSKEALSMAVGILVRRGYAVVQPDQAAGRGKVVRLTPQGRSAQNDSGRLVGGVEQRWRTRFGAEQIGRLRRALHAVLDQHDSDGRPRLARGLRPYPDGWRAQPPFLRQTTAVLEDPAGALPRYPMVLHRGGWPDGS
jgi:DNA-binding MarR family transcriptional regulator